MKKKIAYLVSTLDKTGPTNILYGITKNLDFNKLDIYIITLSPATKNSMDNVFKEIGCNIIELNLNRIKGIFKYKKEILKVLIENSIEVLHSHCFRADYYNSIIKLKNLKKISTLHNYPYEDYVMEYGKIIGILMSFFSVKILKKIDYPIACSKNLKEKWKKYLQIDYIQNGIDILKYHPISSQKKEELRKKLNLPLNKKIFIVSGVLNKRKNPFLIIRAFKKSQLLNSFLVFIGDGELFKECVEKVSKEKNIKFIGRVDNVSEYLKASDYYISSSFSEGLPNSVLEAMATGLPCLLSNIPSHREITNDKNYLFNPDSYEELVEKIKLIEKDQYENLSKKVRKEIEKNFSDKLMAKKYLKYYIKEKR